MTAFRPIIICSPGSAGCSTVAAWLGTNGVHMWSPRPGRMRLPYFEDLDFMEPAKDYLIDGNLTLWLRKVREATRQRHKLRVPWGWKDPRTCEIIDDVLDEFPDGVYVRIRRPRADTVASLVKVYGPKEVHARKPRDMGVDSNGIIQVVGQHDATVDDEDRQRKYDWAVDLVDKREDLLDLYLEFAPVRKFDVDFSEISNDKLGVMGCLPAVIAASAATMVVKS